MFFMKIDFVKEILPKQSSGFGHALGIIGLKKMIVLQNGLLYNITPHCYLIIPHHTLT